MVTPRFAYIVISSIVADFVAQPFLGSQRAFPIPAFHLSSVWEVVFYIPLGILAGLSALAFVRILYASEDLFDRVKIPEYLKPIIGGVVIGLIGLYSADLFGVGYDGIGKALAGQLALTSLVLLYLLKIMATSITIGSGGSGGIFAPSLFIGSMLGARSR